jgi:hypothetical protein
VLTATAMIFEKFVSCLITGTHAVRKLAPKSPASGPCPELGKVRLREGASGREAMNKELRINPQSLGRIMGDLTDMLYRHRYIQGFSPERTRSFGQSILLGWVIKKIKYTGNDWSMEGPVGAANADWISKYVNDALEGIEEVHAEIGRKLSDEQQA